MHTDILHAPNPAGPAGVYHLHAPFSHAVMGYSKNQKLAKDFLRWLHGKEQFEQWFVAQKGFSVGSTTDWEKHKMWEIDPVIAAVPHGGARVPPLRVRGTARTRWRPRSSRSTSSPTCTPRPSRA